MIQLQDTDAGAEVIHLAENGFCADGDQEALVADGALEIGGRLPVNTDGGLHRERRADRRVGSAPGPRDRAAAARPGGRAAGAGQPEGRLHAALRRARHRRRVDPVASEVALTSWTPATRPNRPSCGAPPASSHASSGPRPWPTSTTRTRAKRLADAVRDAGWLELRHDGGDGAPLAERGRGGDRRRRARREPSPTSRSRARSSRPTSPAAPASTPIDGAVVAFSPDLIDAARGAGPGRRRRRSTRSTAPTRPPTRRTSWSPRATATASRTVRARRRRARRRRPHARGARDPGRRARARRRRPVAAPHARRPRAPGPRSASRSRAPISSGHARRARRHRRLRGASGGSTACRSDRSRPCSTSSPRRAA